MTWTVRWHVSDKASVTAATITRSEKPPGRATSRANICTPFKNARHVIGQFPRHDRGEQRGRAHRPGCGGFLAARGPLAVGLCRQSAGRSREDCGGERGRAAQEEAAHPCAPTQRRAVQLRGPTGESRPAGGVYCKCVALDPRWGGGCT